MVIEFLKTNSKLTSHIYLLGLQENKHYEFRVAAQNKAGVGPYSPPNVPPCLIREPGEKPEILGDLNDVTVTSPEVAKLTCSMNLGEPKAKITWYKNGKVFDDNKAESKIEEQMVSLTLNDTKVKDAGTFKVVAENKRGKVESSCELTVLRK